MPTLATTNLQWAKYLNSDQNLIQQFALNFAAYDTYTYGAFGSVAGSVLATAQDPSADGLVIDNLSNNNPVTVMVGKLFQENVPPFCKVTIFLGGMSPFVSVQSQGGTALLTFYKGIYPGATQTTNPQSATQAAIGVFLPPGLIMQYGGLVGNVPDGWVYCNGAAISRTNYGGLFNAIGTLYGAGDGASTFNVPDFRGRFARGFDDGSGVDAGRVLGSKQLTATQDHQHRLPLWVSDSAIGVWEANANAAAFGQDSSGVAVRYAAIGQGVSVGNGVIQSSRSDAMSSATTQSSVSGESRPPNLTTVYIIKS